MEMHVLTSDYWGLGVEACFDRLVNGCFEANLILGPWRIGVRWGWM